MSNEVAAAAADAAFVCEKFFFLASFENGLNSLFE